MSFQQTYTSSNGITTASANSGVHVPNQQSFNEKNAGQLPIQRKLAVGAADDPLEFEADNMADKVMRIPEQSFIQRKCNHCEEEENDGIAQRKPLVSFIQKKENGASGAVASNAVTNQINSTKGGGHAMDNQTQSFMESRFGIGFQDVRIHSGEYASNLSQQLNAQAFTVGNNVYFNQNKYAPNTSEGKHLLAHELTHTIQQNGGIGKEIQKKDIPTRAIDMPFRLRGDGGAGAKKMPFRLAGDGGTTSVSPINAMPKPTAQTPATVAPASPANPAVSQPLPATTKAAKTDDKAEIEEPDDVVQVADTSVADTASATGVSFERNATDCDIVAPDKPVIPTPLKPFVYDEQAVLPDKEATPNIAFLQFDKPWWGDASAEAFGKLLAACYVTRKVKDKKGKLATEDEMLEYFKNDFNYVVQGAFGRSYTYKKWYGVEGVMQANLQGHHDSLLATFKYNNSQRPKDKQVTLEALKVEAEKQMQEYRYHLLEGIRAQVALGTWGWMVERREKLDFDTLPYKNKNPYIKMVDPLSNAERRAVLHGILTSHSAELTEKETDAAIKNAQSAKDRATKEKIKIPLTEDERAAALEDAEKRKIESIKGLGEEMKHNLMQKRNEKEVNDRIIPSIAEWEIDGTSTELKGRITTLTKMLNAEQKETVAKKETKPAKKGATPPPEPTAEEKAAKFKAEKYNGISSYVEAWQKKLGKNGPAELKAINADFLAEHESMIGKESEGLTGVPVYLEKLSVYTEKVRNAAEGNWTHKNVEAVLISLKTEFPTGFRAGNYAGHGGGEFAGRFFSADMYPNEKSGARNVSPFGNIGFFDQQLAYDFALAIDRAVGQHNGTYQILYNDFAVAREANKMLKYGKMTNVDNVNMEKTADPQAIEKSKKVTTAKKGSAPAAAVPITDVKDQAPAPPHILNSKDILFRPAPKEVPVEKTDTAKAASPKEATPAPVANKDVPATNPAPKDATREAAKKPVKEKEYEEYHGANINWHGPLVTHFHVDFVV